MSKSFLLGLTLGLGVSEAFLGPSNVRMGSGSRALNHLQMGQTPVNMPALSSTMTEGKIVSWAKQVGDKVQAGDVLLVVESDKADMDVESYDDGYLAKIYTQEGDSAAVGCPVAVIVDTEAEISSVGDGAGAECVLETKPFDKPTENENEEAPALEGSSSILMPALSSTMTEGKIVSWAKQVGDKVEAGDVLLVVESDKADMDVEAFEDGYLARILVDEDGIAPVGAPVALLAAREADIPAVAAAGATGVGGGGGATSSSSSSSSSSGSPVETHSQATATTTSSSSGGSVEGGRVGASGFAKSQAAAAGIDLNTVTPSRPDGYITSADLATGTKGSAAPVAYTPGPGVIHATPMARKEAAANKIDISTIRGTGSLGRVTKEDVLKAAGKWVDPNPTPTPAAPAAAATAAAVSAGLSTGSGMPSGTVEMDGMQKAVAKNMEATLSVPIFHVSREIYTDDFDALYAQLKPKGVTVSAMLAKAVAMALQKHPIINAAYESGKIRYNDDINVAMAVAIDGGLLTPTIRQCQNKNLMQIGKEWKDLVDKAKEKKLKPADYSGGTFTISNLGMFGVQQFDAILPPNTGSILAIAASSPKVVETYKGSGEFVTKKSMTVTITCDHRHIYGGPAAEFLRDLADLIENSPRMLLW